MGSLQVQLRRLLADRHDPETRALFVRLLSYAQQRALTVRRNAWPDLLSEAEAEDAASEAIKRLMTGALVRFRGESIGELLAFVRTVVDRCAWRIARRKITERELIETQAGAWSAGGGDGPPPEVEHIPEVPLRPEDQEFLRALLQAESKVEYARRNGVSRAAVTQRVQRIQARIAALAPEQQGAVDAWLRQEARAHLSD